MKPRRVAPSVLWLAVLGCAVSPAWSQATGLEAERVGNDVRLTWSGGTAPFRVLKSESAQYFSGNSVVASGLTALTALDSSTAFDPALVFYRAFDVTEDNPTLFDLNDERERPTLTSLQPTSAQVNQPTQVVIDGMGFPPDGSGLTVYFGTQLAKVTSVSPMQLVVEVPPNAVTDEVIACVFDRCSNGLSFEIVEFDGFQAINSLAWDEASDSVWVGDSLQPNVVQQLDAAGTLTPRSIQRQQTSLEVLPPGGVQFDQYGSFVSAASNRVAIADSGVALGMLGTGPGQVHIFEREQGSTWVEALVFGQQNVFPVSLGVIYNGFALHGDRIAHSAIVSTFPLGLPSFRLLVWVKEDVGWVNELDLPGAARQLQDLHDDAFVAVNSAFDVVEVYRRQAGAWALAETITPDGGVGPAEAFGTFARIDGDRLVVESDLGANRAIYAFSHSGGNWTQELRVEEASTNSLYPISLEGDRFAVLSPTAQDVVVNVRKRTAMGTWPVEQAINVAPLPSGRGPSVALDQDVLAVGVPQPGSTAMGTVHTYGRSGSIWSSSQTVSEAPGGAFGASVAVYGGTIAAGAPGEVSDPTLMPETAFIIDESNTFDSPIISNSFQRGATDQVYVTDADTGSESFGVVVELDTDTHSVDTFRPVRTRAAAIAVNPADSDIAYLADGATDSIWRATRRDKISTDFGGGGGFPFGPAAGMRFDSSGDLYVTTASTLNRVTPAGAVTVIASGFLQAGGIDLAEDTGAPLVLVPDAGTGDVYLVNTQSGEKRVIASGLQQPVAAVFAERDSDGVILVAEPTRIIRLADARVSVEDDRRPVVLTHKYRNDDKFPSRFQTEDGKLTLRIAVDGASGGVPVHCRAADPDPPDSAPYATPMPGVRDNQDGPGTIVASPVVTDSAGIARCKLETTDTYSGDNYQVEISLKGPGDFTPIARTRVYTAWKRAYIEYDRMYMQGEFLTTDSGASQPPADRNKIFVGNPSLFAVGDKVHIFAADEILAGFDGEFRTVSAPPVAGSGFIEVDQVLTRDYEGVSGSPDVFPYSFVARVPGGLFDFDPDLVAAHPSFDDAFVDWRFVPGSSFLPKWTPIDRLDINPRSFLYFKNREGVVPTTNHVQLVAVGEELAPSLLGLTSAFNASPTSTALNWSWVFIDRHTAAQEPGCAQGVPGCLINTCWHELGHQWNVNRFDRFGTELTSGIAADGHDALMEWIGGGAECLMNEARVRQGVPRFHSDLNAPSIDLYCIRGHVDDLNKNECMWP